MSADVRACFDYFEMDCTSYRLDVPAHPLSPSLTEPRGCIALAIREYAGIEATQHNL
jgi:hypothetical protein